MIRLVVLFSIFVASFANATEFKTFIVSEKGEELFRQSRTLSAGQIDCKENIRKVVCLVDPADEIPSERPCLEGGQNYVHFFEDIHDVMPASMQKMFCSLKRIYIEKSFFGTAYAGDLENAQGQKLGAVMGIRKSVLDESLNLHRWASWKEQLSFGGVTDSYTPTENRPLALVQTQRPEINDFLYFVVAHEFGHLIDFANGVNKVTDCKESVGGRSPECNFTPGSWGQLSWATTEKVLPMNDFPLRSRLCFYMCSDDVIMGPEHVAEVYVGLDKSNFLSTYAATNAWDDFADSLGYFLSAQNLGMSYVLDTKHGAQYDIIQKLYSPHFASKYQYLDAIMKRTDLVYP